MGTAEPPGIIPLADGFAKPDREDWKTLVARTLKGRSMEEVLTARTYEGVALQALYHGDDADHVPFRQPSSLPLPGRREGWEIRQLHANPEPAAANVEIRADLANGAGSVVLQFDRGARELSPALVGLDGLVVRTVDDLEQMLIGVDLAHTGLAIRAGAAALPLAAMLIALARRRGIDAGSLRGELGSDPFGALAAQGRLPGPLPLQMQHLAGLAAWCTHNAPGLRAMSVDTNVYHDAGASETQDLALAVATGVGYLRALTGAGLSVGDAFRQIAFSLAVGTDVFQAIAKLRAARRLWSRVAEASGAGGEAGVMAVHAVTALRGLSRRDPWVNQLRATCSCFAAGIGGADSITVRAHTDALGLPEPIARRIARNVQVILMQESSLARVADPAGGSYYIERLSADYAERAWVLFQDIEAGGGMAAALCSGRVGAMIDEVWSERAHNLAVRHDAVTGVSSFPDLEEIAAGVVTPDPTVLDAIAGRAAVAPALSDDPAFEDLVAAAAGSAGLAALSRPLRGGVSTISPLQPRRFAEPFEALRDASDRWLDVHGRRPLAFLARLGTPGEYGARAVFASSYLAAGGIATHEADVGEAGVGEAWHGSKADFAVICSSDPLYERHAGAIAAALKAAGSAIVLLAGRPGAGEVAWRDSGIDYFIHVGDDMLATLRHVAREIGMIE